RLDALPRPGGGQGVHSGAEGQMRADLRDGARQGIPAAEHPTGCSQAEETDQTDRDRGVGGGARAATIIPTAYIAAVISASTPRAAARSIGGLIPKASAATAAARPMPSR